MSLLLSLLLGATTTGAPSKQQVDVPTLVENEFSNPGISRPKIRMWLPLSRMDENELRREVRDIARAGFSGIEIIGVPVAGTDLALYGFGTPHWLSTTAVIQAEATTLGLSLDYTATASYPPSVPMESPDAAAASHELVYGTANVEEAFDGMVPLPQVQAALGVERRILVGVTAAKIVPTASTAGPIILDVNSIVDLTSAVQDGRLKWRASSKGDWLLIVSWQRSAGHTVNSTSPSSVVIDHFSLEGSAALVGAWDRILPAKGANDKILGDVFEDSLHLKGFTLWTPDFLAEFEKRRGYSLRRFLPTIFIPYLNDYFYGSGMGGGPVRDITIATAADFEMSDGSGARIRDDYYQTLTDLYNERHLTVLRSWLNARGFRYRVQPSYGQSLEGTMSATLVDVPETESFQLQDLIDGYRVQAAAVHLSRKPIYSAECCAVRDAAYGFGWRDTLDHVTGTYAGGVNQVVLHGYGYLEGPSGFWPGWTSFGHLFSENYPRIPTWKHASDITAFLGRQQLVLRQGEQMVDLAVYRSSYWDNGRTRRGKLPTYFEEQNLSRAGYTYEYLSPALLALTAAEVRGGRLAPDGPGYRAIVLDNIKDMPVVTITRLIDMADAGLPIIIIGKLPEKATGLNSSRDEEVRELSLRLASRSNVTRLEAALELPAALQKLQIVPSATPQGPTELNVVRRRDGSTNYYYLRNGSKARVRQQMRLEGSGLPTQLSAWTGKVEPLSRYFQDDTSTMVPVDLMPGETTIIALGFGEAARAAKVHIVDAPAEVFSFTSSSKIYVSTERSGTYVIKLQDGSQRARLLAGSQSITLNRWSLELDEWLPGAEASTIRLARHKVKLNEPMPWVDLPGLSSASGIGTYKASFLLKQAPSTPGSLMLRLGKVSDSVRLRVNGKSLPAVDQYRPEIDITQWTKSGVNEVEIEVASTLRNRMKSLYPEQSERPSQPHGLGRDVSLTRYFPVELK